MTVALFSALLLAQAALTPAPTSSEGREIVVQGRPIAETGAALAACVARRCPPGEDIDASLAHAENQFLQGDFAPARATLRASLGRNKRAGPEHAQALADLYRADARIASHLGYADAPRQSQAASLLTLRSAYGAGDSRVLIQRVLLADQFARAGRIQSALNAYRDIAEQAARAGDKRVEGYARFRRAVVYTALVEAGRPEFAPAARAAIGWFADRADPEIASLRDGALLLAARPDIRRGDAAAIERVAARRGDAAPGRAVLLYAPVVREYGRDVDQVARFSAGDAPAGGSAPQWADVSFRVTPDGRVADVAVLREGPGLSRGWLRPYLDAIGGRRYSPVGGEGMSRVERYTRVPIRVDRKASRVRAAGADLRVEVLDLTAEAEPPADVQPALAQPAAVTSGAAPTP